MIVQTREDWFVNTFAVVSELELVLLPTLPPFVSTQLIAVALVASAPPGRSASGVKLTVTSDAGLFPKSLSPIVPPEVAVTE